MLRAKRQLADRRESLRLRVAPSTNRATNRRLGSPSLRAPALGAKAKARDVSLPSFVRASEMRALLYVVLCAVAMGGCGQPRGAHAPGTVTFLIETMPINLDPRIGTDAQSQHLDGLLFNGLVAHDARMNIVPDLAESWETPDPRTYVFHLRRGVNFHDGRALRPLLRCVQHSDHYF